MPYYFELDELRAEDPALEDTADYPDEKLGDIRDAVENALEHETACNVAFVPRERTETLSGSGTARLIVTAARVRTVLSAVADDVALDVTSVRAVTKRGFWRPELWPAGDANLVVTYEHGYDAPPGRVKRAALTLAKNWAITGPIDDRATGVETTDGGVINFAMPGVRGATFGLPEIDAVVTQYRERPSAYAS